MVTGCRPMADRPEERTMATRHTDRDRTVPQPRPVF
ncbi:hypothetical protein SFIMM107S_06635 [Streptomyces griseus]